MERAGDDPVKWDLNLPRAEGMTRIRIRDRVEVDHDVPWHRGLEIQVEGDASDLDDAIAVMQTDAEAALILLSAAGRAQTGPAEPWVAYEVTDGVSERAFAQWYKDLPIVVGKTPVRAGAFGALFEGLFVDGPGVADERLMWRVLSSLSFHRFAMEETDPLTRFLALWIAFEALTPLLGDHYGVAQGGFGGLRALANDAIGDGGSEFVSQALGLRRDVFHARRVPADEIKRRAKELVPRLEDLVLHGWLTILNRHEDQENFPAASVIPYPARLVVKAIIHQRDTSPWQGGVHPHFEGHLTPSRVPTGDDRDVGVTYTSNLTVRNADGMQLTRMEIRGPLGPNVGQMVDRPLDDSNA
jgi:hypothetical protein